MILLKVVGTGSGGNSYLLFDDEANVLVLDCGMRTDLVKRALNYNISKISGVYISHAHGDHALYRNDYKLMGCDIFAPYEEIGKKASRHYKPWYIRAFKLPHGETSSYGALIEHDNGERLLYLTDMEYCPFNFKDWNVNHIMVECNYQPEHVDLEAANKEHKLRGHCNLNTAIDLVLANKTEALKSVTLIHAGIRTLNPTECVVRMQNAVGNDVAVNFARNGKEYVP